MSAFVHPITAVVWEKMGATLMARIVGNAGVDIVQADITAIVCKVFDIDDDEANAAASPTVVVADAIFDNLQTDAIWTKDATGYNFKFPMDDTIFTNADHRYVVEFEFDPSGAGEAKFAVVYRLTPNRLLSQ